VGVSGLGLSLTYYACPMQPEASASPCCPVSTREPAPEPSFERSSCCEATHVDIAAAPSEARRSGPELKPVAVIAVMVAPPVIAAQVARPVHWLRPISTHGPPPLERTTRLLI
jgi:hypothetical protein